MDFLYNNNYTFLSYFEETQGLQLNININKL